MLFAIRIGLLAMLYLFLWGVVRAIWADVRRPARGPAAGARASLAVLDPGDTDLPDSGKLPLEPVTTLGRDPSNRIVLNESAVSSKHAVVTLDGRHWYLRDLGSTNGTWLNEERLNEEPVRLTRGDTIQMGRVVLQFTE